MTQTNCFIVAASDFVGHQVVRYLDYRGTTPDYLILDRGDKGGFNHRILDVAKSWKGCATAFDDVLKQPEFITRIGRSDIDLGILAWWPYIVKQPALSLPTRGWVNLHPSYLPYNRGKHPNFWSIVDETLAGVTIHVIDSEIDAGPIIARQAIEVGWEDTGETLYLKSREAIVALFVQEFDRIMRGQFEPRPQNKNDGTFHRAREIEPASEIKLDEMYSARKLLNTIRARTFPPHPSAYFYERGVKYYVTVKISKAEGDHDGR